MGSTFTARGAMTAPLSSGVASAARLTRIPLNWKMTRNGKRFYSETLKQAKKGKK
jgi:hypothetical protein